MVFCTLLNKAPHRSISEGDLAKTLDWSEDAEAEKFYIQRSVMAM